MGNRSKGSFPFIELLGVILFLIFLSIYFFIQYFNNHKLKIYGEEKEAVVINKGWSRGGSSNYSYFFCLDNNQNIKGLFAENNITYKRFIYGDKITIKYLPSNPKINKPMHLLYKKDPEIRKKYEKEFLKKLNKEEPVNEYWNGWNDVLNYQHRFPLHSEYPCLPPWY